MAPKKVVKDSAAKQAGQTVMAVPYAVQGDAELHVVVLSGGIEMYDVDPRLLSKMTAAARAKPAPSKSQRAVFNLTVSKPSKGSDAHGKVTQAVFVRWTGGRGLSNVVRMTGHQISDLFS